MQVISDDENLTNQPAGAPTLTAPAVHTAPAGVVPPVAALRRRGPKPIVSGAIVVGFAAVGLAAGAVLGTRAPAQFQTGIAVEVEQVMSFNPWEANLQTARFGQAILRPDLQEEAAALVGLERSDFLEIASQQTDDSPIVQVQMVVEDPSGAADALSALVDVTLRDLVDSELSPQQLLVGQLRPELDAAIEERNAMWTETGEAPGTDLAAAYNQATFGLESAVAELEVASEQWRIDQLPGIIAAQQSRVDRLQPVLDRWYDVTTRISQLEGQVAPAEDRIRQLELGLAVVDAGSHRSAVEVTELPRSSSLLRWAAGGTAIGIALALSLLGAISLLTDRRRR